MTETGAEVHCMLLLKALADPTRLHIVETLADGERNICQLVSATELSQPTVSHHVKRLREAGLVEGRREGNCTYYHLHRRALAPLVDHFAHLG